LGPSAQQNERSSNRRTPELRQHVFQTPLFPRAESTSPDLTHRHFSNTNSQLIREGIEPCAVLLQERLKRTLGRFLSGCVRIKAKNNFIDETLQNPRLALGKRRALGSTNVRNPPSVRGVWIKLASAQDTAFGFNHCALGLGQTKNTV